MDPKREGWLDEKIQKEILPTHIGIIKNRVEEILQTSFAEFSAIVTSVFKGALSDFTKMLDLSNSKQIKREEYLIFIAYIIPALNEVLGLECPYLVVWLFINSTQENRLAIMGKHAFQGIHDVIDPRTFFVVNLENEEELAEVIRGRTKIKIHFKNNIDPS